MIRIILYVLTAAFLLISINSCTDDTNMDDSGIDENISKITNNKSNAALATRFAPKIWLHSCENLYPSDPKWFMDRTDMRFTKKGNDPTIITNVTSYNINKQSYVEGSSSCRKHNEKSGGGYPSNFYLQIPNDSNEDDTRRGNSTISQLKLVVSIRDREGFPGLKTIQYWMFYPFNALCSTTFCTNNSATECGLDGAHEGDWEHITVVYNESTDSAVSVYMSAHEGEGRYYSPAEIVWENEHPVIYSALGSHASYNVAGTINRPGILPNDYTNQGTAIASWTLNNYLIEDCDTYGCLDVPGVENFIEYSGYWGELGATFLNPIPGSGPRGPAYKRQFFDGLETRSNTGCNYAKVWGLTFYENNGYCSGDKWMTSDAPLQHLGLTNRWNWTNDEIRSMALSNVRQGTRIKVYDSSCGSTNDDWTEIYVKQDISPTQVINITTFEKNANTSIYQQTYHEDNGLDGKISLIKVTN